ncbi:MAG: prepilin-type N-terminal cleavage/methylation domain-containing protein [Deltaproteobacteria bacterium]|nr:prepilin-type N-terminal cleavage/methylation domain-containing protein [Deltaproteobacteria bacterium]
MKDVRGFTVIELMAVVFIIAILAYIALPLYTRFVQTARETAVISYLAKVNRAEEIYRIDYNATPYSGDFDALEYTKAIPEGMGGATRVVNDYRLDLTAGINAAGDPFYQVTATPLLNTANSRWFYMDETGAIRYAVGGAANAASPSI